MKTKTKKPINRLAPPKPKRRLTSERRALLESYFSNAVVLAALLESAKNELRGQPRFL